MVTLKPCFLPCLHQFVCLAIKFESVFLWQSRVRYEKFFLLLNPSRKYLNAHLWKLESEMKFLKKHIILQHCYEDLVFKNYTLIDIRTLASILSTGSKIASFFSCSSVLRSFNQRDIGLIPFNLVWTSTWKKIVLFEIIKLIHSYIIYDSMSMTKVT